MTKSPKHGRASASSSRRRPSAGRANAGASAEISPDVTRHVNQAVQNLLWGRAAGRCQFNDCNRDLSRSPVTQETRNLADKAHIRAFSLGGPRADMAWPPALLNDVENLMLLCHDCHVTIDRGDGPAHYTAAQLVTWKRRHEQRIEIVGGVAPKMSSHVVTYGTHVGEHHGLPTFRDASAALFPHRFPADAHLIALGTRDNPRRDRDDRFWDAEREQLRFQFDRQVRVPIERGDIRHVSVFALAPQPLLIQLGVHLGDITPVETYQRHREPPGWTWPPDTWAPAFEVTEPEIREGVPALVLSLSATITADRVKRVLGDNATIWMITLPEPHNDITKSRAMLTDFRQAARRTIDRIQARYGHTAPLHVFPAMSVALAIELGRVRMPKADAPWVLYDEQQSRGGFVPAFTITAET